MLHNYAKGRMKIDKGGGHRKKLRVKGDDKDVKSSSFQTELLDLGTISRITLRLPKACVNLNRF